MTMIVNLSLIKHLVCYAWLFSLIYVMLYAYI